VSNPLAIAAVTATIGQLVGGVVEDSTLSGTRVSMLPPDLARPSGTTDRQLNLFLYEIAPNAALRNQELPFRDSAGAIVDRPRLALDLRYLLTAYGLGNDEVDGQHLLAHAMSLVHDSAYLDRSRIRTALAADTTHPELSGSDLADDVELVRITPTTLTQEELFKLWSAFQTHYRLSVGYEVSAVFVERPQPVVSALPVREATVRAVTMRTPTIEAVDPQIASAGATLTISGRNLKSDVVLVDFGDGSPVVPDSLAPGELTVGLPTGLRAGTRTVRIVQQLELGDPAAPHDAVASEIATFVLAPRVTTPEPISVARGGTLTLALDPPVGDRQRVTLLLGSRAIPIPPRSDDATHSATSLAFPVPTDVAAGTYLLRVQVDGGESPLALDGSGAYAHPVVTIT
jgi:hypothetical protein